MESKSGGWRTRRRSGFRESTKATGPRGLVAFVFWESALKSKILTTEDTEEIGAADSAQYRGSQRRGLKRPFADVSPQDGREPGHQYW